MRHSLLAIIIGTLLVALSTNVYADEELLKKFVHFANTKLVVMGTNPVIVAAVKSENAKKKTMDQIKSRDLAWRSEPGISAFMRAMMTSACGRYLKNVQTVKGIYAEIFVTDNQGANVCMTQKTTDYWQGDEAKFQKAFLGGKGAVHVGEVSFDESTKAYLTQISIPVKDDEKVIGTITFGVNMVPLFLSPKAAAGIQ